MSPGITCGQPEAVDEPAPTYLSSAVNLDRVISLPYGADSELRCSAPSGGPPAPGAVLSLRALVAIGTSQRQIAQLLDVSQPAISQQLHNAPDLAEIHPEQLLQAAASILRMVAEFYGYEKLSVFGSVARQEANMQSDIDLLVEVPDGTSSFDLIQFHQKIEYIIDRKIDLISVGGVTHITCSDIIREAVLL